MTFINIVIGLIIVKRAAQACQVDRALDTPALDNRFNVDYKQKFTIYKHFFTKFNCDNIGYLMSHFFEGIL